MRKWSIKLFGRQNSDAENIRRLVEREIIRSGLDADLMTVSDPQEFLKYGIEELPCLWSNGQVYHLDTGTEPGIEIKKIMSKIMNTSSHKRVKQIMVPVDYSMVARNAFFQAIKLAKRLGVPVVVLHVHAPAVVPAEGVVYIDQEMSRVARDSFNKYVDDLSNSLTRSDKEDVEVKGEFRVGGVTDQINHYIGENPDTFVILSSTGSGQKIKEILGSVSLWIVKHLKCPILLIPGNVKDVHFDHILYSTAHFGLFDRAVNLIRYLTQNQDAEIDIVHLVDKGTNKDLAEEQRIMLEDPGHHLKEIILFNDDFSRTIQSYIGKNNIDLLVMLRKERGFWRDLFHQSMTRKMAIYSEIPLLVLQEKDLQEL